MVSPVPPSQYSRLLPFFPDIPENVHIRYFLTKEQEQRLLYVSGNFGNYESPGKKPHSCLEYRQKQPSITKGCPKNRVYPNIYKNLHLHTK